MSRNTYRITAKNGAEYEVDADDDAQAARLEAFINERIDAGDPDLEKGNAPDRAVVDRNSAREARTRERKRARDQFSGPGGYNDLVSQGLTFGLSDEMVGLGHALVHPLTPDAYEIGRDSERLRLEEARERTGWSGTAAEFVGGAVGAVPRAGVGALLTLGQAARQGAKAGALYGGVSGFGSGNGAADSLFRAGFGALGGTALGAALPVAAHLVDARITGFKRLFGSDRGSIAREVAGNAIRADANTGASVAQRLRDAAQRGVPLSIADTGDNARALLASVSRQPGPGRTLSREAVTTRQVEQGDRVLGAIGRDLGRIGNMRQESDNLMQQARAAASPLYDQAYAVPGRTSDELEAILRTPAGRQALARARVIAANERRDPTAMGFDLDDQGEVVLTRVPSAQTLDYVKRGLDDIIEQHRDPVTQRLSLDEAGRAVNQVRAQLVGETDRLNPIYGEARAAYAGPASAEEALQSGRRALTASAEDIEAAVGRMSPFEREQYALGFRAAMADNLGRATDGADKVGRLLGTPRKRAALASVFGSEENFGRFLQTMADERATTETYRSVMTGSQSAERLAADAQTNDAGLVDTAMGATLRGVSDPVGLIGSALEKLRNANTFGVGRTGDETRESVAALLTESDPAVLNMISRAVREAMVKQGRRQRAINRTTGKLGGALGVEVGSAIGAD